MLNINWPSDPNTDATVNYDYHKYLLPICYLPVYIESSIISEKSTLTRACKGWFPFIKYSALARLFAERALISDRQSLISIAERLGEAKTTAEHNLNSEC